MTLTSAIDAYLTLKRSLGAGLKAQETMLRAFGRALGEKRFCRKLPKTGKLRLASH